MSHNITITRGDTWTGFDGVELLINATVPASPIVEAEMLLRRTPGRRDVAMTFSTADGSIVLRPDTDNWIEIPPRLMDLAAGDYRYDLQITFADERVLTILSGIFRLLPDVSHTS